MSSRLTELLLLSEHLIARSMQPRWVFSTRSNALKGVIVLI